MKEWLDEWDRFVGEVLENEHGPPAIECVFADTNESSLTNERTLTNETWCFGLSRT